MRPIKRQILDDRLFLWQARAMRKPYFHGGFDSPPLTEHLRAVDFDLPTLSKHGRSPFKVSTLAGELQGAIHVHSAGGTNSPLIIYHHDAGEVPATRALQQVFPDAHKRGLAILAVEAPFHANARDFETASGSLLTYLAMQAVTVAATERLLQSHWGADAPLRVISGYGQGGYVTNWHHVLHDTADLYIPFMAGAAQAELFLNSLPTASRVKHRPEQLRRLLNCDAKWGERTHNNVFPVLGSADMINRFDAQARAYGDTPIEVWALGHLAATRSPERMRAKIVRHIQEAAFRHAEPAEANVTRPARWQRARG